MARFNLQISESALLELNKLSTEMSPTIKDRIHSELTDTYVRELLNLPRPLEIVVPGRPPIKNKALIETEARHKTLELVIAYEGRIERERVEHERLVAEKDVEIRTVTRALADAQHQMDASSAPIPEESVALSFWNSVSIKPGLFGLSVDIKTFVEQLTQIVSERSRPIQLHLNQKRPR